MQATLFSKEQWWGTMAKTADETQSAVRGAMTRYRTMVLSPENFDNRMQIYKYPHAISAAEVLRMAGVKSRATLSAEYHEQLKAELDALVVELKGKTGKGRRKPETNTEPTSGSARLEQLAQTIGC